MKNFDFILAVNNVLDEQNIKLKDLFENKIISQNTFYKYKQRTPSLETIIKICNYLNVSIDYLFELKIENNFVPYNYSAEIFYNNILSMLKIKKTSGRKFCSDLNYSKDNLLRWKSGTTPSIQTLIEISNYLDCSIDELLSK